MNRLRQAAINSLVLFTASRTGQASAAVLLSDDCAAPTINAAQWTTNIPSVEFNPGKAANSSVVQSNGQLSVSGRGYLITQNQFPHPIQVSGDATFVDTVGGVYNGPGPVGLTWSLADGE